MAWTPKPGGADMSGVSGGAIGPWPRAVLLVVLVSGWSGCLDTQGPPRPAEASLPSVEGDPTVAAPLNFSSYNITGDLAFRVKIETFGSGICTTNITASVDTTFSTFHLLFHFLSDGQPGYVGLGGSSALVDARASGVVDYEYDNRVQGPSGLAVGRQGVVQRNYEVTVVAKALISRDDLPRGNDSIQFRLGCEAGYRVVGISGSNEVFTYVLSDMEGGPQATLYGTGVAWENRIEHGFESLTVAGFISVSWGGTGTHVLTHPEGVKTWTAPSDAGMNPFIGAQGNYRLDSSFVGSTTARGAWFGLAPLRGMEDLENLAPDTRMSGS